LDSCTTYGTQLLWPFTDDRVAWNTISIIDPLFTIPLLSLIILAVIKKKKIISYLALFWVIFYSIFGLIQKERAEAIGAELASSRGHELVNVVAKPSFANLIVWKIIYTTKDSYYIDAVRLGLEENVIEGVKIDKLNIQKSFPWLDLKSQQARDIERFRWFSNGYLALSETHPNRIIDIRYSMLPNEGHGLWGIELRPNANQSDHVVTVSNRRSDMETYKKLWKMISN
jgi:inner membrane protein